MTLKNKNLALISALSLALFSQPAFAALPVPEIDGAGVGLALGLTVAIIALVKERRRK